MFNYCVRNKAKMRMQYVQDTRDHSMLHMPLDVRCPLCNMNLGIYILDDDEKPIERLAITTNRMSSLFSRLFIDAMVGRAVHFELSFLS